jgi:hypothetical protein
LNAAGVRNRFRVGVHELEEFKKAHGDQISSAARAS